MQDQCKSNQSISLELGVIIRPTNWMNGGWLLVVIGSEYGFWIILPGMSHTVTGRFSWQSAKWLTPTRYPEHFGSSLADIRIRIRINPEMHIRMPEHFRLMLELDAMAEVCALWAQLGFDDCRRGLCGRLFS